MATRFTLSGLLDRNAVNGINDNFNYLFNGVGNIEDLTNGLKNDINSIKLSNNTNFANIFSGLETALKMSDEVKDALEIAQQVNAENQNVQSQINELIISSGESDAEVIQARVDAKGGTNSTLKERIDKVEINIDDVAKKSEMYNKVYGTASPYTIPNNLGVIVPFNVYTSLNGKYEIDYDVSVNKVPVNKTYYVDVKNGNNSNSGTEQSPFKSINRAIRYGDMDQIIVKEGIYGWADVFNAYRTEKSFNMIGQGTVILGSHRDNLTWTKTSGYNNVYQTNASSVIEVVDAKNISNMKLLKKLSDVSQVSQNAGSYFIDSSNNIYVRTHDNRIPDEYILPNIAADVTQENINKLYFENIIFTNTVKLKTSNDGYTFYAKNCTFAFGTNGNALSLEGYNSILQNCVAEYAMRDGFNYHISNGNITKSIEIDCIGRYNGRDGADQNNGSTSHDGGQILRIGGEYHNNHGPNVIDVNEGSVSVNVGVHAHSSTATSNTVSNSNFKNGNVGASEMYLVNCVSHNSDYSVVTSTSTNSVTTINNSLLIGPTTTV